MRTCPSCQFLVADGAEVCSICRRPMAAPPAAGFAPPGTSGASAAPPTPPPFAGVAPGFPQTPGPGGYANAPGSTAPRRPAWVVAAVVVVGVVLVAFAGVAGLSLIGTTVEPPAPGEVELRSAELDWRAYEDPAGSFAVDLPGEPVVERMDVPGTFGSEVPYEAVTVSDPTFRVVVGRYPGAVPMGATFDDVPFSTDAAERMFEAGGFEDATVVAQQPVQGSANAAQDLELSGRVSGEPALLLSRLVMAGSDVYELNLVGPEVHRQELVAMHDRIAATFTTP